MGHDGDGQAGGETSPSPVPPAVAPAPGSPGSELKGGPVESVRLAPVRSLLPNQEPDLHHLRAVLVRYATGRVGDPHIAEDLVQDTLLVGATGARPDGPPEPYLVGVLKNKVADHFRRTKSVTLTDPENMHGLLGADPSELPHELVERAERAALARRLLNGLGDRDRDLLVLRMAGASAAETGRALDMSEGAVRVAQHRALERLRVSLRAEQALQPEGGDFGDW